MAKFAPTKVAIGGTHHTYCEWLHISKTAPSKAFYADTPEKLLGLELKKDQIVRLGQISIEMEQILQTRIR